MTQVMKGVRMLEVAQFTFVPAAGAVLTDWGADVIKIEHPVTGDDLRSRSPNGDRRGAAFLAFNRSKRSIAIDLTRRRGRQLARRLVAHHNPIHGDVRVALRPAGQPFPCWGASCRSVAAGSLDKALADVVELRPGNIPASLYGGKGLRGLNDHGKEAEAWCEQTPP